MQAIKTLFLLTLVTVIAAGCASARSGKVYSRGQVQEKQTVQLGTVIAVDQVLIEGTKTPVGAGAGTVVGGVVGRGSGNSSGDRVRGVLGAVLGGIAGAAAEEGLTRKQGLEITIELDDGKTISVVQEADQQILIKDRVRILTGGDGTTRVVPL